MPETPAYVNRWEIVQPAFRPRPTQPPLPRCDHDRWTLCNDGGQEVTCAQPDSCPTCRATCALRGGVCTDTRRCPRCSCTYPRTTEYFYQQPSNGRWEYCQGPRTENCHPQYWRERQQARRSRARYDQPLAPDKRKFGVEIEFIGDMSDAALALREAGLDTTMEWEERLRRWIVKPDGSVYSGGELASPPLVGVAGRKAVRKACKAMREAGMTVDRSCGLHVHHDVTDLNPEAFRRMYRFWFQMQPVIDQLVAPSRRNGEWSRNVTPDMLRYVERLTSTDRHSDERGGIRALTRWGRYYALNVCPFPRQGTIEIRQHQGTLDARKIIAWTEMVQALISWAKTDEPIPDGNLAAMLRCLSRHGLKANNRRFLNRHSRELAGAEGREVGEHAGNSVLDGDSQHRYSPFCTCALCDEHRRSYNDQCPCTHCQAVGQWVDRVPEGGLIGGDSLLCPACETRWARTLSDGYCCSHCGFETNSNYGNVVGCNCRSCRSNFRDGIWEASRVAASV